MDIGKRIRNLRESKNMRVTELAKKAFISQPYLSDIENGRTTPSLDKLSTICDALEISLAEFFGYESKLSADMIRLLDNMQKLTEEERRHLSDFLEAFLKRSSGNP
ncbi:helix-turn-helix domain-containing protein [Heyndrickxia coagulans]|uniref:helix-turn-helix domain-containing protein n=1 Tax=Heyndrickxia coagulans TaxID=1398 RepID=UPI000CE290FD|nr:helix-turn-helix transcriptional regulator [Heyndrickxia coagulans]AVD55111.1 XRE family transcriptional regulator [Heyndrickxia coagulans]